MLQRLSCWHLSLDACRRPNMLSRRASAPCSTCSGPGLGARLGQLPLPAPGARAWGPGLGARARGTLRGKILRENPKTPTGFGASRAVAIGATAVFIHYLPGWGPETRYLILIILTSAPRGDDLVISRKKTKFSRISATCPVLCDSTPGFLTNISRRARKVC
jgi:hypothetical protein